MLGNTNNFKTLFSPSGIVFALFIVVIGFSSCQSTEKAINQGDYEQVIDKMVGKLHKKKKDKFVLPLEEAFAKANARNLDRIDYLKKQADPSDLLLIYREYKKLSRRGKKVLPVLPLYVKEENRLANIEVVNYNEDLAHFRAKAAEYLYVSADLKLDSGDKYAARDAFDELMELKSFYPNYRNLAEQLNRADRLGSNHILVTLKNNSALPLPLGIEAELKNISIEKAGGIWADFYFEEEANVQYDYLLVLHVMESWAGPEQITERLLVRAKEIEDGYVYEKDDSGNFVLDTLGRKIKIPVFKQVEAEMIHISQHKESGIVARLELLDIADEEIVASFPLESGFTFHHEYGIHRGDPRALQPADRNLCAVKPLGFPSDYQLLLEAARLLPSQIEDLVYRNDDLVVR